MLRILNACLLLVPAAIVCGVPPAADQPQQPTVVTADRIELVGTETHNYFVYEGNVAVQGTNLTVTADRLEMTAGRRPGSTEGAIGELGAVELIVAIGNVVIHQEGREARSGRAQVFPHEGKLVLTESPVVEVGGATVSGWRITLLQGEKRAYVEANPADRSQRPTVTADALPDLGFDQAEPPPSALPPPAPADPAPGGVEP